MRLTISADQSGAPLSAVGCSVLGSLEVEIRSGAAAARVRTRPQLRLGCCSVAFTPDVRKPRMSHARTYPAGVPCWIDSEQPDPEAACRFYGELFGWEFTNVGPPQATDYFVATFGGDDVAAIAPGRTGAAPAWNTYIAV